MAGFYEIEINLNHTKNKILDLKGIKKIDSDISYNTFFNDYLLNNVPVILKNVTNNWNSTKYWINNNNNKIDFSYLKEKYGDSPVMIYNCNIPHYNSQKTETGTLSGYLNNWSKAVDELLYLKDFHLKNQYPNDDFYEVPLYFASDWLNEYLCECGKDDYRFVYIGPKDTWTPFHADVFTSFSWSANVSGQKKWYLFPPGEELKLIDHLRNLPYDIRNCRLDNCKYLEIIQNAGEAIFVPSGWYHQVFNLTDCVSINHNWVNGCNIKTMWQSLCNNLVKVEKEIDDCRDMEDFDEHCQVMLKASYGIDFKEFYCMLQHIAEKRINLIKNRDMITLFERYHLGENHAIFDLQRIFEVVSLLGKHPTIELLKDVTTDKLLEEIETNITK